jgi:hypothetical protein
MSASPGGWIIGGDGGTEPPPEGAPGTQPERRSDR